MHGDDKNMNGQTERVLRCAPESAHVCPTVSRMKRQKRGWV